MRYRILEYNDRDKWIPVTVICEHEGRLVKWEKRIHQVEAESLESLTTHDFRSSWFTPEEVRLSPILETEDPDGDIIHKMLDLITAAAPA